MSNSVEPSKRDIVSIIKSIDTRTQVLALITLIAEALFVAALVKLPENDIIWALVACASILVICVIGIVVIETLKKRPTQTQTSKLRPADGTTDFTAVYEVTNALEFYRHIAHKYDERNTAYLLDTHRSVIDTLETVIQSKPDARILDLGGGTGRLIAAQFFNKKELSWTYIDNCPGMGEEFRRNLSDTQLKTSVLIDDISNTHNALRGKQFDAIVMSNILTSMPRLPDFALILPLLTPDGALIIADIDPSYTVQHPYYSVKLNGESYALKPNPVNPIELCQLLCSMNMQITVAKPVRRKGGTNYSFCLVFKPES